MRQLPSCPKVMFALSNKGLGLTVCAPVHSQGSYACVFRPYSAIHQLPYRIRWQDLKDLFRRAGTVLRADVALGPDNRSRGHGTVLLASQEDAERALSMFQGWCWQGRVLEVRKDRVITGEEGLSIGSSLPSPMAGAGFAPGLGNGVPSPAPMSRLNSGMGLGECRRLDVKSRELIWPFNVAFDLMFSIGRRRR